ncbi:MAG: biotin/lipoyl-containing protein [Dehalococcoidia bacterium]|nr:biotin/lipoyl-containing protein [Dehalococcoidia bacterium]
MRYNTDVGERSFEIEINVDDTGNLWASLDRVPYQIDMQCVDGQRLYSLMVGNHSYELFIDEVDGRYLVSLQGQLYEASVRDSRISTAQDKPKPVLPGAGDLPVKAPMPGLVIAVHVVEGDEVTQGTRLVILAAMKMENEIVALRGGRVTKVQVKPGQRVGHGDVLLVIS